MRKNSSRLENCKCELTLKAVRVRICRLVWDQCQFCHMNEALLTGNSSSELGSVYNKHQPECYDTSVLIENISVTWKWVAIPFWSTSIVFNENRITSVIAELRLTLGVNRPLTRTCCVPLPYTEYVRRSWGPFTLSDNVCLCVYEHNRSNGDQTQTQRIGSVPIFCINLNVYKDTALGFIYTGAKGTSLLMGS